MEELLENKYEEENNISSIRGLSEYLNKYIPLQSFQRVSPNKNIVETCLGIQKDNLLIRPDPSGNLKVIDINKSNLGKELTVTTGYTIANKVLHLLLLKDVTQFLKNSKSTVSIINNTSGSLGYPKVKERLAEAGELNNLEIHKIIISISNLSLEQEMIARERTAGFASLNDDIFRELPNAIINFIVIVKVPNYKNTFMKFYLKDCKFNIPNYKGYNAPLDRTINIGCYARVIRQDLKYNNFDLDELVMVNNIFLNSKTPQKHNALCTGVESKKVGLAYLRNLKRIHNVNFPSEKNNTSK